MKVLHLIRSYLPPSQVWLYNLLKNSPQIEHHIASRKLLPHNFYNTNFKFSLSQQGPLLDYISSIPGGIGGKFNRLLCYPQQWSMLSESEEWGAYISRQNIQLVHAHFAPYACVHLKWLQALTIPFVVSFYGYDYEKVPFDKPKYEALYQRLFQSASAVICEGPHGIKILEEAGCAADKLSLVPLGVDLSKVKVPFWEPKKKGELKLLQIADFTPKKGQLDSIAAALLAKKKLPGLSLTLVGNARDQAYFQTCENKIEAAGAGEWIRHIPFVAYDDLPALISQHHVFIHPSRYAPDRDCEGGAPTILFNVQAMGMPVISTLHCDIPNVVKDGVSGRLVSEGRPDELALQILYFAELSIAELSIWRENTQAWGQEVGNINKGVSTLLKVYKALI